jgi:hypothetical protein
LAILLPDQQRATSVLNDALDQLAALPAWSSSQIPVPNPDVTPMRPRDAPESRASPDQARAGSQDEPRATSMAGGDDTARSLWSEVLWWLTRYVITSIMAGVLC